MVKSGSCRYFLGANSKYGFYSLYDAFIKSHPDIFLWCIKGGPGSGKSTFMRRIGQAAEENGLYTEYILCSGDPDSLDGVYIPDAGVMYVDATSPHVAEPSLPGANSRYLDLSFVYRDRNSLREREPEIRNLFSIYRKEYSDAYDFLQAASLCAPENKAEFFPADIKDRITQRASALLSSVSPSSFGFREERRFLSALSCKGHLHLYDLIDRSKKICTVDNNAGLANIFLEAVRKKCISLEQPVILFPDPVDPNKWEGIYLPAEDITILAVDRADPYPGEGTRHIRLDAMAGYPFSGEKRSEWRDRKKVQKVLTLQALQHLKRAKEYHDELEALYRPFLDFSGIDGLFDEHRKMLFAERS